MTAAWGTLLCVHPCISRRPSYYNGEGLVPLRSHRVDCFPQKLFSGRQSKQRSWFAGVHAVAHGDGEMPRFNFIQKLKKPSGISFGEELMRLIAGASSAPIAQYISSPRTLLHSLDPRVKQAWLFVLVFLPSRSHVSVRVGIVMLLSVITILFLPRRTWQDQLGRVSFLSVLLLLMVSLGADSIPPIVQTRTPPPQLCGIPPLPSSFTAYKYVLWKLGPFQLTRKGLALGTTSACLSFTVLQSASLCLSTTMPEHLAEGIRWYLAPLRWLKAPVDEIILTLLLSLRFVALVFDEVRNIALGIVARGVQWKKLSSLETAEVFFTFLGRVFKNLFNHSEQIAQAMVVRGFQGVGVASEIMLC
ncbi:hypothetical protein KP509_17G060600 [Ceratopteris richardii]|uniref:Protein ABCI12, chloroplastic n=1 Tax=Ceratopteris richardii TaxID=49495 RepID=A0A8T2SY86_CERRI|nr:hypothetical protein KP509_17G060600 [Ceratopteris richardii]